MQTAPTATPITLHEGPGTRDQRVRRQAVLQAAQRATAQLSSGMSQKQVALVTQDPLSYGIGVMMFRLAEKRILADAEDAYRSLGLAFEACRSESDDATPVNRRTVIQNLRKTNHVDPALSVKSLKPCSSMPNVAQVLRVTEQVTEIPVPDILSRNRCKEIVTARFFAMWTLRNVNGTSFSMIGDHFGGKDHTTVINAVNQVDLKRMTDKAERVRTDQIIDESDLVGVRTNMELLIRSGRLRTV